jgi:hypothetical protein
MTETQRQSYEEAKIHGFVVVSGPVYGTYKVNGKQYHSSTFEALMKNNLLKLVNREIDRHLIIETFETNNI